MSEIEKENGVDKFYEKFEEEFAPVIEKGIVEVEERDDGFDVMVDTGVTPMELVQVLGIEDDDSVNVGDVFYETVEEMGEGYHIVVENNGMVNHHSMMVSVREE